MGGVVEVALHDRVIKAVGFGDATPGDLVRVLGARLRAF